MGFMTAVGGLVSTGLNSALGYASQKSQYRFSKKERLQGPSWDVQGLRKAGLNPILAAGARGGSSSGVAPFSAADLAGASKSSSESNLATANKELVRNQIRITSAKADREEMINNEWKSNIGKDFYVPLAASSAAGASPSSVADTVLLPSLIRTAHSAKDSSPGSIWKKTQDSFRKNLNEVKEFHMDNVKRYNQKKPLTQ